MRHLLFFIVLLSLPVFAGESENLLLDPEFKEFFKKYRTQPAFTLTGSKTHRILRIQGVPHMGKEFNARQLFAQQIWETPAVLRGSVLTVSFSAKIEKLEGSLRISVCEANSKGPVMYHIFEFAKKPCDWTPVKLQFNLTKKLDSITFCILACNLKADDEILIDKLSLTRSGPLDIIGNFSDSPIVVPRKGVLKRPKGSGY